MTEIGVTLFLDGPNLEFPNADKFLDISLDII